MSSVAKLVLRKKKVKVEELAVLNDFWFYFVLKYYVLKIEMNDQAIDVSE